MRRIIRIRLPIARSAIAAASEPLPASRDECRDGPRPCPFIRCRWNLYLDVLGPRTIRMNFPHLHPWQVPPDRSCALDIAERGPATLSEIGDALGLTRERARQVESEALRKLRAAGYSGGLLGEPAHVPAPKI